MYNMLVHWKNIIQIYNIIISFDYRNHVPNNLLIRYYILI